MPHQNRKNGHRSTKVGWKIAIASAILVTFGTAYGMSSLPNLVTPTDSRNLSASIVTANLNPTLTETDSTTEDPGLKEFYDAQTSTIPAILENESLTDFALGYAHGVAVTSTGRLVAWGDNTYGQATPPNTMEESFQAVAAGATHSLALTTAGQVIGWGRNADEQTDIPADLPAIKSIAAGSGGSMALDVDGKVHYWGEQAFGQGIIPEQLDNTRITQICMGSGFNLALTEDGNVVAWGRSDLGQLRVPTDGSNIIQIAAGAAHAMALSSNGDLYIWGAHKANADESLQISDQGQLDLPGELDTKQVIQIGAGAYHSSALTSQGQLYTWGWDRAYTSSPINLEIEGQILDHQFKIDGGEQGYLLASLIPLKEDTPKPTNTSEPTETNTAKAEPSNSTDPETTTPTSTKSGSGSETTTATETSLAKTGSPIVIAIIIAVSLAVAGLTISRKRSQA